MSAALPLFQHAATDTFVWHKGKPITAAAFMYDVLTLVESLPDKSYLINLCEDRYHFMLGFAAAAIKGQVTLLPPNRSPDVINDLADEYADSYTLLEEMIAGVDVPSVELQIEQAGNGFVDDVPLIDGEQLVVIAFTSGSTGKPKPNPKSWQELVIGAEKAISRFKLTPDTISTLIATVPPQHMYGLETSVMVPWQSGIAVHSGRPFFPGDVVESLAAVTAPRVLVTTPLHLRACVKADMSWPEVEFIISATAPLSTDLAQEAESTIGTRVLEIYGCTEAGSIASRRTTRESSWQLYEGMTLTVSGRTGTLDGEQLRQPVILGDQVESTDRRHFTLLGRNEDMVNIAGKRASLGDLNHKLNAIDGVDDGAFVMPDVSDTGATRLAAFVVAPMLEEGEIIDRLKDGLDAVFLPRPLYKVDALPRNETGKLPRSVLIHLLQQKKRSAV